MSLKTPGTKKRKVGTPRKARRGTGSTRRAYGRIRKMRGRSAIIKALKCGLPVAEFESLREDMDVSAKTLGRVANIATRTLSRRKKEGRMRTDESERVFRLANLFDRATRVLGSKKSARIWMKAPQRALGGIPPLEYADTEPGAAEVSDLLGRLEHGVFS